MVNDSLEVILAVAFLKLLRYEHSVVFSMAKRTKRHVHAPGHPVCSCRQRVGTKPCDLADRCGFQAPHSHITTMRPSSLLHFDVPVHIEALMVKEMFTYPTVDFFLFQHQVGVPSSTFATLCEVARILSTRSGAQCKRRRSST